MAPSLRSNCGAGLARAKSITAAIFSPFIPDLATESPSTYDSRWIDSRRGAKQFVDPKHPYAVTLEEELGPARKLLPALTIFLTNSECPWRCLMCDLWKNTLDVSVAPGDIPMQINEGLGKFPESQWVGGQIKLYNSGSFFDRRAIPPSDHAGIAQRLHRFSNIVVECHPALVGEEAAEFRKKVPALEVAMGLETVHPRVLERLNKKMSLEQYRRAADYLARNDIALRTFVLLKPPFLDEEEAIEWACRSIDFAMECQASVTVVIPTRKGNGAMEELEARGLFSQPKISSLETVVRYGVEKRQGRVFADLWDLERFVTSDGSWESIRDRLKTINQTQRLEG